MRRFQDVVKCSHGICLESIKSLYDIPVVAVEVIQPKFSKSLIYMVLLFSLLSLRLILTGAV